MKLNPSDKVTKDKYPIIFANKVNELVEEGMTKDEAEKYLFALCKRVMLRLLKFNYM